MQKLILVLDPLYASRVRLMAALRGHGRTVNWARDIDALPGLLREARRYRGPKLLVINAEALDPRAAGLLWNLRHHHALPPLPILSCSQSPLDRPCAGAMRVSLPVDDEDQTLVPLRTYADLMLGERMPSDDSLGPARMAARAGAIHDLWREQTNALGDGQQSPGDLRLARHLYEQLLSLRLDDDAMPAAMELAAMPLYAGKLQQWADRFTPARPTTRFADVTALVAPGPRVPVVVATVAGRTVALCGRLVDAGHVARRSAQPPLALGEALDGIPGRPSHAEDPPNRLLIEMDMAGGSPLHVAVDSVRALRQARLTPLPGTLAGRTWIAGTATLGNGEEVLPWIAPPAVAAAAVAGLAMTPGETDAESGSPEA